MYSFKIENGKITGTAISGSVPVGNTEVGKESFQLYQDLRAQAAENGMAETILWDGSAPQLPADTRPIISVFVNGQTNVSAEVGEQLTVELRAAIPDMPIIIPVFGRRFKFQFVDGVATKIINLTESRLYEIKSNEQFKIEIPVTIDVVL